MNSCKPLLMSWVVALCVISLTACAAPTATTLPSTRAPSVPPTPTQAPLTASTVIAALGGKEWSYAAIGDSSTWGFMRVYPQYIEEDLGVKVNLRIWAFGGYSTADVLALLRRNKQEQLDISQSQVITFYGSPLHLIGMRITNGNPSEKYDCSPQVVAQYKAELGAIADEIFTLRKGQPTIIRTYTRFMPFYRIWNATGAFEEYRRCVAALDTAILEVGKERGILVADTGLALNGPNHDQDPNDMGYLMDTIHENDEGAKKVADVFRKLGYAYVVP